MNIKLKLHYIFICKIARKFAASARMSIGLLSSLDTPAVDRHFLFLFYRSIYSKKLRNKYRGQSKACIFHGKLGKKNKYSCNLNKFERNNLINSA